MAEKFQPILLKNGERRTAYIQRRADEGAAAGLILSEINSEPLHPDGKPPYSKSVVWDAITAMRAKATKLPAAKALPTELVVDADALAADGVLTAAEIAQLHVEAEEDVRAEQRAAAKKRILEEARDAARRKAGLVTGIALKDDLVKIRIDLPEYAPNLMLNMKQFWHGFEYTVPRHVYDTLREMSARAWKHQAEIDGKGTSFYRERGTTINVASGRVTGAEGLRV